MVGLHYPRPKAIRDMIELLRAKRAEEIIDLRREEDPLPIVDFDAVFIPDNAQQIAWRVGRPEKIVRVELGNLMLLGLLESEEMGGEKVFRLTRNAELRDTAIRFASQLELAQV